MSKTSNVVRSSIRSAASSSTSRTLTKPPVLGPRESISAAADYPFRGAISLTRDDVDERSGHDDRLPDLGAVQVRLHPRRRLGALDQLGLGQVSRDLHAVPH